LLADMTGLTERLFSRAKYEYPSATKKTNTQASISLRMNAFLLAFIASRPLVLDRG